MEESYTEMIAGLRTETKRKFSGQMTFNRFKKAFGFSEKEIKLHHLGMIIPISDNHQLEANYLNGHREWTEKKDKEVIIVEVFEKGQRFLSFNITEDGVRFLNFRDINQDKEKWVTVGESDIRAAEWGIRLAEWLENSIEEKKIKPLPFEIKRSLLP